MKYNVTISSRTPSQTTPRLFMEFKVKNNQGKGETAKCVINDGGVYKLLNYIPNPEIETQKKDRNKIVAIELPLVSNQGIRKFWSENFTYYDTKEEAEKNGISSIENENTKMIVSVLKSHPEVSFKDSDMKELNSNISPIILKYNLIDKTERVQQSATKKIYVVQATSQIYEWFESNQQKLCEFGYVWGAPNVKSEMTSDEMLSLFDYLFTAVSSDMNKFNRTLEYMSNAIKFNIIKASRIMSNGNFIIYKEGNFFMFNGKVIGEGQFIENAIESAAAYFSVKPQEYLLLKNTLGIEDNIPEVKVIQVEAVENSSITPVSVMSLSKNPHENKEESKLKTKIGNLVFRIVNDGKDIGMPKKGNAYQTLSETGRSADEVLKQISEMAEIKDNVTMQEFMRAEVERVKIEKTPYSLIK